RISKSVVAESVAVVKQRERAEGIVEVGTRDAKSVKDKRVCSERTVLYAVGVERKRRSADSCVGLAIVESQRSTADSRIEVGGTVGEERTPTKCCISSANAAIANKSIITLKGAEVGVATV